MNDEIPDWFKPLAVSFALGFKVLCDAQRIQFDVMVNDAEQSAKRWQQVSEIMKRGDVDRAFVELGEFVAAEHEQAKLYASGLGDVKRSISKIVATLDGMEAQFPWINGP